MVGTRIALGAALLLTAAAASLPAAAAGSNDPIRVSTTGVEGVAQRGTVDPNAAYNPYLGEYLVTWSAVALAIDDDYEIFAQRVGRNGRLVGAPVRLSTTGVEGDPARAARQPNAAYNPRSGEYLVTWLADGLALDDKNEVFARRLRGDGALKGGTFRVSRTGSDRDAARDADGFPPSVVYDLWANQYLVTWTADGLATDDDVEVFARLIR